MTHRDWVFWCALAFIVGVYIGDLPSAEQSVAGYGIALLLVAHALINVYKRSQKSNDEQFRR